MRCLLSILMSGSLCLGASPSAASAGDVMTPLDLTQVRVGGEIGRRIELTVKKNLLALDIEKDFLPPFRAKTSGRNSYIALGKNIDAAVRFAAYTKDEKVIALKKRLIEETIKTQDPDGYIGTMNPQARFVQPWDIHEMGYILKGLTSDYHFFKEKRSLDAACKLADYFLRRWPELPPDWPLENGKGVSDLIGMTGFELCLLSLYHETGDRRYLDFCVKERALPQWDLGIVIGRRNRVDAHVYNYIVRCMAQLDVYRLQPQPSLLTCTRRAINFLTHQDGMAITGGAGQTECWTDDQDVRKNLGETCATAYQIRFYDQLMRMEGGSLYGDLIERTIYNALFAAQSPDGRKIRYYAPLEGNRIYWEMDTYCCPGNFRRMIADLPTLVYYRSGTGLTVSLYTPSEATVDLNDGVSLRVRQETDYPTSGRVVLHLDSSKPATFPLGLRIPRWCGKATVTINGQPWEKPIATGSFLAIERKWTAGDKVTLDMPMSWRLVLGRKRQSGRAAVMRGPLVYCLNPAQNAQIQNRDGADLSYLMLDPSSLKDVPGGDTTVRPGGTACAVRIRDYPEEISFEGGGMLSLKLKEFPDADGKCVYFRLPDLSVAVSDELALGEK